MSLRHNSRIGYYLSPLKPTRHHCVDLRNAQPRRCPVMLGERWSRDLWGLLYAGSIVTGLAVVIGSALGVI